MRSTRERRHRTRRGLSCHPLPGRGVSGGSENEARERRSSRLGHKRSVRLFSRNKRRDKYLKVQPARAARALGATKTAFSGKIREARGDTRPPNVWRAISRETCESERVTHFVWASYARIGMPFDGPCPCLLSARSDRLLDLLAFRIEFYSLSLSSISPGKPRQRFAFTGLISLARSYLKLSFFFVIRMSYD